MIFMPRLKKTEFSSSFKNVSLEKEIHSRPIIRLAVSSSSEIFLIFL